jgi:hypothetical protein
VYHPLGWSGKDDFESELLVFPNGAHDDQVDTVSYAALQLPFIGMSSGGGRRQKERGRTITGGILKQNF